MQTWEALVLGVVQGLTEFLPVSSSGHLVMAEALIGMNEEGLLFEIVVHVGTLLAILLFYQRRIAAVVVGVLERDSGALVYTGKLALATLPVVVVGLLAKDAIARVFDEPWLVGVALFFTGSMLLTTRWTVRKAQGEEPTWAQAFVIGCAQVVAIVPGISRSGTTVAVALALGVAPLAATEFSFLMAIPAIAGAAILVIPDALASPDGTLPTYLMGGLAAFASGLAAIWLFVRLLQRQLFHVFAWYCFVAGAAFLLWTATR
jgi:undecaprenyl-diphosphatase